MSWPPSLSPCVYDSHFLFQLLLKEGFMHMKGSLIIKLCCGFAKMTKIQPFEIETQHSIMRLQDMQGVGEVFCIKELALFIFLAADLQGFFRMCWY